MGRFAWVKGNERGLMKRIFLFTVFVIFLFSCQNGNGVPVKLQTKSVPDITPETEPSEDPEPDLEQKTENTSDSEQEEPKKMREWTFMIYMACDNSLESYGLQDLNEMEAGIINDDQLSVIAFVDRHPGFDRTNGDWDSARVYEIRNDSNGNDKTLVSERKASSELDIYLQSETELDSSKSGTLKNFIEYCRREYEAENYALFLWGIGSGWKGNCYDGTSNSIMPISELGDVLKLYTPNFLVLDTDLGMSFETIYEFKDLSMTVAGFSGINQGSCINYETFLKRFCESDRSSAALTNTLLDYSDSNICVMETAAIKILSDKLETLGKSLSEYIDTKERQKYVMNDFLTNMILYKSSSYPCDGYIDALDMAYYLQYYEDTDVSLSAGELYDSISEAVVGKGSASLSIHIIPFISVNVPDQMHSENYVSNEKKKDRKCSFVNDSLYWCPTEKDQSFLDALFYRVLN